MGFGKKEVGTVRADCTWGAPVNCSESSCQSDKGGCGGLMFNSDF